MHRLLDGLSGLVLHLRAATDGDRMIEVVDCSEVAVNVTAGGTLEHRCPFRDEVDRGHVAISWRTEFGKTIELHSLRAYLDGFAERVISHEELTELIVEDLNEVDIAAVMVTTSWETAGMQVEVASL